MTYRGTARIERILAVDPDLEGPPRSTPGLGLLAFETTVDTMGETR